MKDFITEMLQGIHRKAAFDCGRLVLNDYLHKQAGQDVKRRLAACFILKAPDNTVIGYYMLSNASIPHQEIAENLIKNLPPAYKELPCTLLGRLAVDVKHQRQNLGELLLIDALKRAYLAVATVGSLAVIVDPIDEPAEKFYFRYGFIRLRSSGKMFLPMSSIVRLFTDN